MTAHVLASATESDPRRTARVAGVLYLIVIAAGLFAEGAVRSQLITPGDAAATGQAIAANTNLWRTGLAVHLLYHLPAIVLYGLLYRLFRPVHTNLARLALLFAMVSLTIEAVALLQLYVPLAVLERTAALAAFTDPQRQALSYLATELFATGWAFGLIHFGAFCLAVGLLIIRTGLVPRAIGLLMIVAGVCYPINSLTYSFMRDLSDELVPWILLPALIAELSLASWLTLKGVNASTELGVNLGTRSD